MSAHVAPSNGIQINIDTPFLTVTEFARRTGLTVRAVQNMIYEGRLPVQKRQDPEKRQRVFINMILLAKQAAEQEF